MIFIRRSPLAHITQKSCYCYDILRFLLKKHMKWCPLNYFYSNTKQDHSEKTDSQLPKFHTLAITIYHYCNLDMAVIKVKSVENILEEAKNEINVSYVNSGI